jgi:hypothetical protein
VELSQAASNVCGFEAESSRLRPLSFRAGLAEASDDGFGGKGARSRVLPRR